ncbi:hypothetical protein HYH03_014950 [Edaphochlamys debaryana]|uniref:EGF-like domain-containing protein n=1 Tax=Edaphochlamys debaryana TaxID=47281 RepID=A0A836BRN7_9CHLO|nr:hypothetical protein HYH03_014950 [Edaphochlamys debaryana]|eukprot:KAG2486370.1 hypothetical protein HYH03_014950 [Edaphochlamys debaryana]
MALALSLAALCCLPRLATGCGHHVVHQELRSVVDMHLAMQAAHPHSGAWGPVLRLGSGEEAGTGEAAAGQHLDDEEGPGCSHDHHDHESEGRSHDHDHGHDGHGHVHGQGSDEDEAGGQWGDEGAHGHTHGHQDGAAAEQHSEEGEEEGGHVHGPGCSHSHHHDQAHAHDSSSSSSSIPGASAPTGADARRRRLAAASPPSGGGLPPAAPAPLRLAVAYQRLDALSGSQQAMLTRVVEAVRRILSKFIMVKRPPSGGLLADPYCLRFSRTAGCLAYYPDFVSARPLAAATQCGLATVLPQHVTNPASCARPATAAQLAALATGAAGPASGAGDGASGYGSGCSSYAGTQGEDADMFLYITAVQNEDCAAGAAAWARPCLLDLGDNRPLLGGANVCPAALGGLLDEGSLVAVLAHEMIHALGFTESMFNLTRRADGTPRPLSEVVAQDVVDGTTVSRLITPAVRDAARQHFGCPGLAGAQLEEEGSAGSAGSHWEYNHFQGEVMVASTIFAADGSPPTLSNLTLSYLDDTNWYVTNRSAAGLLSWGRGAGCLLPGGSCRQYMAAVPGQRLFCDAAAAARETAANGGMPSFRCSSDYKATGVCRSLNFTSGCGLLLSRNAEQTCTGPDAALDLPDVFGWGAGGPSTRCLPTVYKFSAALGPNRYTFPASGRDGAADAACFDTLCTGNGSAPRVGVRLFGRTYDCPAGTYLDLPSLLPNRFSAGRIGPCPPAAALCATQSCPATACNPTGGDCLDGACYCRLGYAGRDCSLDLVSGLAVSNAQANASTGAGAGDGSALPAAWAPVVQVSLLLFNPVTDVVARRGQLAAVLAAWAELDPGLVDVSLVTRANASSPLTTGGDSGGISTATQAGQAYDTTPLPPSPPPPQPSAGSPPPARRRDLLQAASPSPSPPPAPPSPAPSPPPRPPPSPRPRPPSPAPPAPPAAPASSVTALLRPGSGRAATLLSGRLRDATQAAALLAALAAANFTAQNGSVTVQMIITKATTSPPPPPLLDAAPAPASSGGGSKLVIIIAIAAGATALVGLLIGLVVVVVRRRRAAAAERYAAGGAAVKGRGARYAVPAEPVPAGRGPGGPSGRGGAAYGGAGYSAPANPPPPAPAPYVYAPPPPAPAAMQPSPRTPAPPQLPVSSGASPLYAGPPGPAQASGAFPSPARPDPTQIAQSYYAMRAAALGQAPVAGQAATQAPPMGAALYGNGAAPSPYASANAALYGNGAPPQYGNGAPPYGNGARYR